MGYASWTGGQYSLCRVLFGAWLCLRFWRIATWWAADGPWPITALAALAAVSAIFFALGYADRIAATIILVAGAHILTRRPDLIDVSLPALGCLLLTHLLLPPAPYGSWAARGRPDPGGDWRLRRLVWYASWIVLASAYIVDGGGRIRVWPGLDAGFSWLVPYFDGWLEIGFAPLAIFSQTRPWAWTAMAGLQALRLVFGDAAQSGGMLILHLLTFDPRWVAGGDGRIETLFYDGGCGLCHRAVRFILAEDSGGTLFRFAPLQGALFLETLNETQRRGLPDSLVLLKANGEILTRSRAVRHALLRLGGYWALLGRLAQIVPPGLGDFAYDQVARMRSALFKAPHEACPVTPAHLRVRFVLS